MQLNQRQHERIRARFPADVRFVGEGTEGDRSSCPWTGCSTRDVSTGGVRLEFATSATVRVGATLRLRVKTAWWRRACHFDGDVRWVRGDRNASACTVIGVRIEAARSAVRQRWYRALRQLAQRQGTSEPAPA